MSDLRVGVARFNSPEPEICRIYQIFNPLLCLEDTNDTDQGFGPAEYGSCFVVTLTADAERSSDLSLRWVL